MPQRFYYDENDLDGTVNKLDRNLMEMLDFAYLHEDMVNTIEALMSDWGKENIPTYSNIIEEYENMPEDQKQWMVPLRDYLYLPQSNQKFYFLVQIPQDKLQLQFQLEKKQ